MIQLHVEPSLRSAPAAPTPTHNQHEVCFQGPERPKYLPNLILYWNTKQLSNADQVTQSSYTNVDT